MFIFFQIVHGTNIAFVDYCTISTYSKMNPLIYHYQSMHSATSVPFLEKIKSERIDMLFKKKSTYRLNKPTEKKCGWRERRLRRAAKREREEEAVFFAVRLVSYLEGHHLNHNNKPPVFTASSLWVAGKWFDLSWYLYFISGEILLQDRVDREQDKGQKERVDRPDSNPRLCSSRHCTALKTWINEGGKQNTDAFTQGTRAH